MKDEAEDGETERQRDRETGRWRDTANDQPAYAGPLPIAPSPPPHLRVAASYFSLLSIVGWR